jgi:hypothetical protein
VHTMRGAMAAARGRREREWRALNRVSAVERHSLSHARAGGGGRDPRISHAWLLLAARARSHAFRVSVGGRGSHDGLSASVLAQQPSKFVLMDPSVDDRKSSMMTCPQQSYAAPAPVLFSPALLRRRAIIRRRRRRRPRPAAAAWALC